jgi:hypothetical protein
MNARAQIICAWCGYLCPIFMFAGLWPAAGFFPPTLPTATAQEIATLYQQNAVGIRVGTILFIITGALFGAFAASISAQMRRMETRATPVLSYGQLAGSLPQTLFFIIPALIWTAAAYRPERAPEITQALNDIGWFIFVMPFTLPSLQNLCLGFAIINDKRAKPVMPRWVGFFNIWLAVLYVPGGLVTLFKTGPFAWNGLLAFWIPASAFGVWFYVVAYHVIKAAKQQAAEEPATD